MKIFIILAAAVASLQSCPKFKVKEPDPEPVHRHGMAGPHLVMAPKPLVFTITATNPADSIIFHVDPREFDSIQSLDHPILVGDSVWSDGIPTHLETIRKMIPKKDFRHLMAEIKEKQY